MTDTRDGLFAEALSALALAGDSDTATRLQRRWEAVERGGRDHRRAHLEKLRADIKPSERGAVPVDARPTTADKALEQAARIAESMCHTGHGVPDVRAAGKRAAAAIRSLKGSRNDG